MVGYRLRNLHHLTLGNRHTAHHRFRVHMDIQFLKNFRCGIIHFLFTGQRTPLGNFRKTPQPHIVHYIALQRLIQLLVHHRHTVLKSFFGRSKINFIPFQVNMAAVFIVYAKQALHQRRLSGSVLSHQCVNRTRLHGQIYIIKRLYTGEFLTDALHFQEYTFVLRRCCLFFQIISPPF